MQSDYVIADKLRTKDLTDVLIRVGLIAFVVVLCVRVFAPFMGLMLWALILAVALYPLHQRIARWLGGRSGRAEYRRSRVGFPGFADHCRYHDGLR